MKKEYLFMLYILAPASLLPASAPASTSTVEVASTGTGSSSSGTTGTGIDFTALTSDEQLEEQIAKAISAREFKSPEVRERMLKAAPIFAKLLKGVPVSAEREPQVTPVMAKIVEAKVALGTPVPTGRRLNVEGIFKPLTPDESLYQKRFLNNINEFLKPGLKLADRAEIINQMTVNHSRITDPIVQDLGKSAVSDFTTIFDLISQPNSAERKKQIQQFLRGFTYEENKERIAKNLERLLSEADKERADQLKIRVREKRRQSGRSGR